MGFIWQKRIAALAGTGCMGMMLTATASAETVPIWYNCYTREVWTAEKQEWCGKLDILKNAEYTLPALGSNEGMDIGPVRLINGQYENADEQVLVTFVDRPEALTFADLNGDGEEDAAAMVAVNTGGSGVFLYLVALLGDGATFTEQSAVGLGDRVYPQGLAVNQDGLMTVDLLVQGPEDPQCCPTLEARQLFRLQPDLTQVASWAKVTGTVSYQERMSLPPGAEVTVKLVDVSWADAPAPVLAEQTLIVAQNQVPIPFELLFDPTEIDTRFTYAVQARIEIDGELMFISDIQYPVLTQGHPTKVDLVLRRTPR